MIQYNYNNLNYASEIFKINHIKMYFPYEHILNSNLKFYKKYLPDYPMLG